MGDHAGARAASWWRPHLVTYGADVAVVTAVLAVLLALLALPPIWYLVYGSLHTTLADGSAGSFTVGYYADLLSEHRLLESAANSAFFAVGSAALAITLGGVQAWLVERTNAPFRTLAYLGAFVSLAIPFILYVVAWLFILGKTGPVNDLMKLALGTNRPPLTVESMWGMIVVEGLLYTPLAFLMLCSTFRASNAEFEEAAMTCGASTWATLRHVTFRLATPALLALALLVFIRAMEAFEVPALVGLPGRINVLTTEIFLSLKMQSSPDLGRASAFAVVLLVVVSFLLYYYGRIARSAARYHTVTGKGYRPRRLDLGRGRWLAGAANGLIFLLVVVLPLAVLAWVSLMPFYQGISLRGLRLATLDNYRAVLDSAGVVRSAWNTLFLCFATATAIMSLAAVTGWLVVRRQPGAWLLDQLGTTPLIFPGIVLAVAMMQIFLAVPLPVYGTIWILLIAFTTRYLPYGLRYSFAGVIQIHAELEEAAGASGASPLVRFRRVVLPLIGPAMAAGWLFIFLMTARDLSMPVLLAGPSSQVVAVELFDLWTNGQATELAAFGLMWTVVMTVIAAGSYLIAERAGVSVYGN